MGDYDQQTASSSHLFTAARKAVEVEPEPDEPRPVLHEFIYAPLP